jgi:hypothetical protein
MVTPLVVVTEFEVHSPGETIPSRVGVPTVALMAVWACAVAGMIYIPIATSPKTITDIDALFISSS